jgi:hypothetical protein
MIILFKMRKYRIFNFFFTQTVVYNFLKQHKSTKFNMSFRMVYKLSYMDNKKMSIFRGDPCQKKVKKIFF